METDRDGRPAKYTRLVSLVGSVTEPEGVSIQTTELELLTQTESSLGLVGGILQHFMATASVGDRRKAPRRRIRVWYVPSFLLLWSDYHGDDVDVWPLNTRP